MWIFAIVLVALIGGTLAMGIWFVSVPLALVLLALPLLGGLARRYSDTQQIRRFRDRSGVDEPAPEDDGRDHSTLYERDRQGQPVPGDRA
jgi:hypothetical protein